MLTNLHNHSVLCYGLTAFLLLGCGPGSVSDGGSGEGTGETGQETSPCSFPLDPCPNDDCTEDGRRQLLGIDCTNGCVGQWSGTDAWSTLIMADLLLSAPAVDRTTVWPCEPDPDVDLCVEVDQNGHIGCFRFDDGFAVAVWPSCAVAGEFAVDAGNGMCSAIEDPAGDGDGDGDPAGCQWAPTLACSDDGCWASDPSWTAEARATEFNNPGLIVPGIWVPVNLGIDAECWELDGVGTHVCLVDVCGESLLGTPADEMTLEPDASCEFVGAWTSTARGADGCYGLIDGVAVELRAPNPICVVHPWFAVSCWVPWFGTHARTILPCEEQGAVDGGAWSAPYEKELAQLGPATCHDVIGTEFVFCLFGPNRVLLTLVDGEWVPQTDNTIDELVPSAPPCG